MKRLGGSKPAQHSDDRQALVDAHSLLAKLAASPSGVGVSAEQSKDVSAQVTPA